MKLNLINPPNCKIKDVVVLPRVIHFDPRGFLIETLRVDDREVDGKNFVMSYTSATPAGVARDENQWHYHAAQVDRFIVPLGEIALALADQRDRSKPKGLLQVLHLKGVDWKDFEKARQKNLKFDVETFLITIPVGVYHCYKNIGKNLAILQNFPTQLYNSADEGRKLFTKIPVKSLDNKPFSWSLIKS